MKINDIIIVKPTVTIKMVKVKKEAKRASKSKVVKKTAVKKPRVIKSKKVSKTAKIVKVTKTRKPRKPRTEKVTKIAKVKKPEIKEQTVIEACPITEPCTVVAKEPEVVKKKKPKNYLNNADLLKELEISNKQNKLTDKLAYMFQLLTLRYSQIPRFVKYTYNTDMQRFAMYIIVKVWRTFDAKRSQNPFAYFTQTIKRAFYQFDNAERKQRDIRDAQLVEHGENPSFSYTDRYNQDNGGEWLEEFVNNPDNDSPDGSGLFDSYMPSEIKIIEGSDLPKE